MQKTGSFGNTDNLLRHVIVGLGLQIDVRFDGLGDTGLVGSAGSTAKREMGVLNDAVSLERQFRHIRVASHLGHEAQADSGRDQGRSVGRPTVATKTLGFV